MVVSVDSEGLMLAGVEVFLRYDQRLLALIDLQGTGTLLGQVLADTSFALSDSVAVIHFSEADLVGKPVSGSLFVARFQVMSVGIGFSIIGILQDDALRKTSYTVASREGTTAKFEAIHALLFGNSVPRLFLPVRFGVLEDGILVVNLRLLAQDAESKASELVWQVTASDSRVTITVTDSLSAVLMPAPDYYGNVMLTFTVTDPAGGFAQRMVPLRIEPVNDSPKIIAGVLPDSVVVNDVNTRIILSGAASDVDGDTLIWSGVGQDVVQVFFDEVGVARIFAPQSWRGEAAIILQVTDPSGEAATHRMRVIRRQALNVLPGDFDGDGKVGFSDFLIFAQAFGKPDPPPGVDLNGDGRVDFADFLVFAQNFGKTVE